MTTQTPTTAKIEKWLRFGFSQIFDSGPDSKEKRKIWPESTPALRIRGHWPPEMSGLSYFAIQIQSWLFKIKSKSKHSPKDYSNVKSKSKASPNNLKNVAFSQQTYPISFPFNSVQIRSWS